MAETRDKIKSVIYAVSGWKPNSCYEPVDGVLSILMECNQLVVECAARVQLQ